MAANKKIMVEREAYEKNGKSYFAYYINGKVRGIDVKVKVVPPDMGGYTVLDIVYLGAKAVELSLTPFNFTDERSGREISGTTYSVKSFDENGDVYECKVKPFRDSDKNILNMLLKQVA